MRTLAIISLITLSLCGCKEGHYTIDVTRVIKNETSHNIVIGVFYRGEVREEITIGPFGIDSDQQICSGERGRLVNCDITLWRVSDSVRVTFDGNRFFTYCGTQETCLINSKNIMDLNVEGENASGYVETSRGIYEFPLTETDYESADPIDG
ncbi:hypothetical protein [Marinoscillum sp.]|uniref:hypothetical protein n=1 Tax=Marinoscillum sp. TaxID=2024838 RepID=UPI003BA9A0B2